MSLRKAVNGKCRDCIHDELAAGTWLQQVALCPDDACPLYGVRPKTKSRIPESVLVYYGIKLTELKDIIFDEGVDKDNPDSSSQVVKLVTSQACRYETVEG